jgi:hypothetical protein
MTVEKAEWAGLKDEILTYLSERGDAGAIFEEIYSSLSYTLDYDFINSLIDEISNKGYINESIWSHNIKRYYISRQGLKFINGGGYSGELIFKPKSDNIEATNNIMNHSQKTIKKMLFISYANDNFNKVTLIKKELTNNNMFEAYIVADRRKANDALAKLIKEGIEVSYCIIPILSPQSYKEQWINQEIGFAEGIGKRIVPIVETSILDKLKGFVHKQNQCPYTYKSRRGVSMRDENKGFMQSFRLLIKDLEAEAATEKNKDNEAIKRANQSLNGRPGTRIIGVV